MEILHFLRVLTIKFSIRQKDIWTIEDFIFLGAHKWKGNIHSNDLYELLLTL